MAATNASDEAPKDNPSIKRPDVYQALRDQGASAEKAARISNAQAKHRPGSPKSPSRKGGKSLDYEKWTRADLYAKAREIGLAGQSRSTKAELIHVLRSH